MAQNTVQQLKVMISSTTSDLQEYRDASIAVIQKIDERYQDTIRIRPTSMEKETLSGDRETGPDVSLRWVEESDWVVLIIGWNYGTIIKEGENTGISITELEYRHSKEKKIFVFMAGAPKTADAYRALSDEKIDLLAENLTQTEEQRSKLEKFKQELGKNYLKFFSNLADFKDKLEISLDVAVQDYLSSIPPHPPEPDETTDAPDIDPSSTLAKLILKMRPHIDECAVKVQKINSCKQIHDYLHDLLHRFLRPLYAEVVLFCRDTETDLERKEREIYKYLSFAKEKIGGLKTTLHNAKPDNSGENPSGARLNRAHIHHETAWKVCDWFDEWHEQVFSQSYDWPTVDLFSERLDSFTDVVQRAFENAEDHMMHIEKNLNSGYKKLLVDLEQQPLRKVLNTDDTNQLKEELSKIEANRTRVERSLEKHHNWQKAHNTLYKLDSLRETKKFNSKLNNFRQDELPDVIREMVKVELKNRIESPTCSNEETDEANILCNEKTRRAGFPPTCDFVTSIETLLKRIDNLHNDGLEEQFDAMRDPFDIAFYCIDKMTLATVGRAEIRATKLKEWLDSLALD